MIGLNDMRVLAAGWVPLAQLPQFSRRGYLHRPNIFEPSVWKSLIGNTASQFDPLVQQYIKLALEKDSKVMEYYHKRIDDPRMEKMIDLKTMPISHWPSSEVYHAFNEYLFSSIMLMETSADEDTSIKLQDRITAYGRKFEALKKALDASRR